MFLILFSRRRQDDRQAEGPPPLHLTPDDLEALRHPDPELAHLPDEAWRERLEPSAYRVLRRAGTERAFTGAYWDEHREGVYVCRGCSRPLFRSTEKFDSGTGWPSFWAPFDDEALALRPDNSLWMRRTEVLCRHCGGHLGHVFDDGPPPTGKRFCINSAALRLALIQTSSS